MGQICGKASGREQGEPIELIYFDGPGRGELARLAFKAGGVQFVDTRVKQEAWPAHKENPTHPAAKMFQSMPVCVHGEKLIAQSAAIFQYAADMGLNVNSPPGPFQRAQDMMIVGVHADLQKAMYACLFGDDAAKEKAKGELLEKATPLLDGVERQYSREPGPFLYAEAGRGPTLADIALFNVVVSPFPGLRAMGVETAKYPKIEECIVAVEKHLSSGTVPRMQSGSPKRPITGVPELIYFDKPGRGELIRLAFHAGGVEFTDTRLEWSFWSGWKTDLEKAPGQMFGNVPVIVQGTHMLAQSMACAQYAADIGMHAATPPTPYERAMDMMMLGAHADLQKEILQVVHAGWTLRDVEAPLRKTLAGVERQLKGPGPYLYSTEAKGPSLGDLALFDVVTSKEPGLREVEMYMDDYPKVEKLVETIRKSSARPGLKAYLDKRLAERGF